MIDMLRFRAVLSSDVILEAVPVKLRLYVYGVMSQKEAQKVITYLQSISISFEDFKSRIILCQNKHKYIIGWTGQSTRIFKVKQSYRFIVYVDFAC